MDTPAMWDFGKLTKAEKQTIILALSDAYTNASAETAEGKATRAMCESLIAHRCKPVPEDTASATLAPMLESERSRKGSDIIARKIVIRRDRWDKLLALVAGLKASRGILATPAEVSAIVLDAGLSLVNSDGSTVEATRQSKPERVQTASERAGPVPSVHLNGTSGDSLLGRFKDAASACRSLVSALENAEPNARDFYPQGESAYSLARKAHIARVERVEAVRQELEHLALSVLEIIDSRIAWKSSARKEG